MGERVPTLSKIPRGDLIKSTTFHNTDSTTASDLIWPRPYLVFGKQRPGFGHGGGLDEKLRRAQLQQGAAGLGVKEGDVGHGGRWQEEHFMTQRPLAQVWKKNL